MSKLVKTGSTYERTIYIDGIFEYVILETSTNSYEKNYIHIMDDQSRIAEVRINTGTAFPGDIGDDVVYNLEDQIGSSTVRLDLNGTIIDREEYYPFGDSSLRTFTYKRYRYVGKERDAESGLYYYGARYYAAWTCRFISVDPLAADYPFYTPYNYAGNKPINKIDIDGMQEEGGSNQQNPDKNQTSRQDNTAVAGKQQATNNIGDFKPGVKFKLIIDNSVSGAPASENAKHSGSIDVNSVQTNQEAKNVPIVGQMVSKMLSEGLIKNGSEVKFKNTGARTETSGGEEHAIYSYDLTFEHKGTNVTMPIEIDNGSIVHFAGTSIMDYPLELIGSGIYSQLFKSAIIRSAEQALLKGALPRAERLKMFKDGLSKAPTPTNPKEAVNLINKTLDAVETQYAGKTDRMFGILDDKYVTYNANGSVTAMTKGHRIEIQSSGNFSIFERKSGNLFFQK